MFRKLILLLSFLVITSSTLLSQNCQYLKTLEEADQFKADSNFTWAGQLYEEALKLTEYPAANNYWALVHISIYNQDFKKTVSYIESLVAQGITFEQIENVVWVYDDFMSSTEWKNFEESYQSLRNDFYQGKNLDVLLQIERLYGLYRASRSGWYDVEDSVRIKLYNHQLDGIMDQLRIITHKHGWPSYAAVGQYHSLLCIQMLNQGISNNTRDDIEWKYFKPILKEQVELDMLNPQAFASINDRFLYAQGLPQEYGCYKPFNGDKIVCKKNGLAERRKELCLPAL